MLPVSGGANIYDLAITVMEKEASKVYSSTFPAKAAVRQNVTKIHLAERVVHSRGKDAACVFATFCLLPSLCLLVIFCIFFLSDCTMQAADL